jgi:hypothetical protein
VASSQTAHVVVERANVPSAVKQQLVDDPEGGGRKILPLPSQFLAKNAMDFTNPVCEIHRVCF